MHLGITVAQGADDYRAAVGRAALAGDPAGALESVEDAGHGGGVQPGVSGQGAWAEQTMAVDQVQAVHVHVFEIKVRADPAVEQRHLAAQVSQ